MTTYHAKRGPVGARFSEHAPRSVLACHDVSGQYPTHPRNAVHPASPADAPAASRGKPLAVALHASLALLLTVTLAMPGHGQAQTATDEQSLETSTSPGRGNGNGNGRVKDSDDGGKTNNGRGNNKVSNDPEPEPEPEPQPEPEPEPQPEPEPELQPEPEAEPQPEPEPEPQPEPEPVVELNTWYVVVQAIDGQGQESPDSNEASGDLASGEHVTLSWEAPNMTLDGACTTVDSYLVKLGTAPGDYSYSLNVQSNALGLYCRATGSNACGSTYTCELQMQVPAI
ncbi:hypothetical protein [Thioalkalivibrio sulfidiphilus]|uniref:hypothetical protein n=1 Tax=Thioalkalivibrio sulfidiphilus TaxID=1033854 RepID=UPI003B392BE6